MATVGLILVALVLLVLVVALGMAAAHALGEGDVLAWLMLTEGLKGLATLLVAVVAALADNK